jgi:Iap family predicted aminopeptidase
MIDRCSIEVPRNPVMIIWRIVRSTLSNDVGPIAMRGNIRKSRITNKLYFSPSFPRFIEDVKLFPEVSMTSRFFATISLFALLSSSAGAQAPDRTTLVGSAYTGAQAHRILARLTDEAGGRLMGTSGNKIGLEILRKELLAAGLTSSLEPFTAPGWRRGEDRIELTSPVQRTLRAAALGYSDRVSPFEDTVVFAGFGYAEEYGPTRAKGKIVLVTSEAPPGKTPLLRYEAIDIAASQGARAILFINEKRGGMLLLGVGNFQGKPNAIPAFSVTFEEGKWMERLLKGGRSVTARLEVRSECKPVESANLVARLPGRRPQKILVGAHLDSWDISQGAMDNGMGSAILFDLARLLAACSPKNEYTIEFVWFNGEELGLWGSKRYAEQHAPAEIAAVVNLDMTASPVSFNAMGYDEAVPFLERIVRELPGYALDETIQNTPWTNSDQQPFLLKGIPSIGIGGRLNPEDVRFYHDFGDTFDKVHRQSLSDAVAVGAVLVASLANSADLSFRHKTREEIIASFQKDKVDERLKRQKEWPFETEESPR